MKQNVKQIYLMHPQQSSLMVGQSEQLLPFSLSSFPLPPWSAPSERQWKSFCHAMPYADCSCQCHLRSSGMADDNDKVPLHTRSVIEFYSSGRSRCTRTIWHKVEVGKTALHVNGTGSALTGTKIRRRHISPRSASACCGTQRRKVLRSQARVVLPIEY